MENENMQIALGAHDIVDLTVTAVDLECRVAVRAAWEIERKEVPEYLHRYGYELIQELGSGAVKFNVTIV